jgi:7-cyano-7-deazaguanine synthase
LSRELAVILVSGGMDSCVSAAIAARDYNLAFLHINYGQRTESRELISFHDIAGFYRVKQRLIINMSHFSDIGGSSLTDDKIKVSVAEPGSKMIPTSYVPFRNANLLAAATSWAEVINAKKIFIGAVEEDSSGYPDCRRSFLKAFNTVIREGTRPETDIEIIAPLLDLSKEQIVKKAFELKAPLHLTWSCYKDEEVACGVCDSCVLRLKGFRAAGYEDPIPYRNTKVP